MKKQAVQKLKHFGQTERLNKIETNRSPVYGTCYIFDVLQKTGSYKIY